MKPMSRIIFALFSRNMYFSQKNTSKLPNTETIIK